jgi:hypothetical protein
MVRYARCLSLAGASTIWHMLLYSAGQRSFQSLRSEGEARGEVHVAEGGSGSEPARQGCGFREAGLAELEKKHTPKPGNLSETMLEGEVRAYLRKLPEHKQR